MIRIFFALLILAASGCALLGPASEAPAPVAEPTTPSPAPPASPIPPPPPPTPAQPPPQPAAPSTTAPTTMVAAAWNDLPGWNEDDHVSALKAFVQGCEALGSRETWRNACQAARKVFPANAVGPARRFFETAFQPYRALNEDGSGEGMITGYYEPLLHGSRKPTARYKFPVYGVPDDLLVVDLASLYPDLKGMRLRGRLEGRRIVPYYSRSEIEGKEASIPVRPILWVDDPIELFFLQIQGSGQIRLDSGERVRVGYADQNGHPYRSIGRYLIDRGELTLDKASMQGIKLWAQQNPEKLPEVLNHNASYVFFRELAGNLAGPLGALGVPVSAGRTLAVDPRFVPLGAPVYLATTWPNTKRPLHRLMMAQDTGAAIRGGVRGDYFWGFGEQAAAQAGRMRQSGRMWILLPIGVTPEILIGR